METSNWSKKQLFFRDIFKINSVSILNKIYSVLKLNVKIKEKVITFSRLGMLACKSRLSIINKIIFRLINKYFILLCLPVGFFLTIILIYF